MLFHTIEFFLFLPLVVGVYFVLPHRFRWVLLLAASYYFYAAWKLEYLLLIVVSTGVDYLAALKMASLPHRRARRPYLLGALAVNLALLGFFKYADFAVTTVKDLLHLAPFVHVDTSGWPAFDLLLPIGISFYTFQTIGYSLDVYRGKIQPERHLGVFAVYVSFFPQLVAGPIERAGRLIPQFHREHRFDSQALSFGLLLILWGLFKKLVLADHIHGFTQPVYASPGDFSPMAVAWAPAAFIYEIYCDFSGYTDIALGAALLMGFRLSPNFDRPFAAGTITEFWQRWHMSLGTWLRDYVFFPMSRTRKGRAWRGASVLLVTTLFGIWHGASWNFALFGLIMGLFMVAEHQTKTFRRRWAGRIRTAAEESSAARPFVIGRSMAVLGKVLAFGYLMVPLWICAVFFASESVAQSLSVFAHVVPRAPGPGGFLPAPLSWQHAVFLGFMAALVETGEYLRASPPKIDGSRPSLAGWRYTAATYGLTCLILMFGVFEAHPFLYFQF